MILELLLTPLIAFVEWGFGLINTGAISIPTWMGDTLSLIAKGGQFFPIDVYVVVMTTIGIWIGIQFTWAIVEFVYKKIPGIN